MAISNSQKRQQIGQGVGFSSLIRPRTVSTSSVKPLQQAPNLSSKESPAVINRAQTQNAYNTAVAKNPAVIGMQGLAAQNKATAPKTSSPGTYQGVPIAAGSQEQIMEQMRRIDAERNKVQKPPTPTAPTSSYSPLFSDVASSIKKPEPTPYQRSVEDIQRKVQDTGAINKAIADLAGFRQDVAQTGADIKTSPVSLATQQGRGRALAQGALEKETALAQGISNLMTARGQDISALQSIPGLMRPEITSYGQTTFDPLTGQFGGGGGALDPQVVASQLAKDVVEGRKEYNQAVSSLGYAGSAAHQFLDNAIRQINPNFNIPQSIATLSAQAASIGQTGTLGGQLTKNANTLKEHMVSLQQAYNNLGTTFGIPLLNKGVNTIREAFGSGPLQAYEISLQNVRDELAKILGGGTSTEGSRLTARELIPDNMSPAQLESSIRQATELVNSKIAEYTKLPQFNSGSTPFTGEVTWESILDLP